MLEDPTAAPDRPGTAAARRKRAAVLAAGIEATIVSRGWSVGEVLGSESELLETYGVSRGVLREAVRILESHQIARSRRGPSGGLVVTKPNPGAVTAALLVYLDFAGTDVLQVLRARRAVEPLAASLAAVRPSSEPGGASAGGTPEELLWTPTSSLDLARRTGNPVLELFVRVLVELTSRWGVPVSLTQRQRGALAAAQDRVLQALVAADPEQAGIAARARIDVALEVASGLGAQDWPRDHLAAVRPSRVKMAERVADRIQRDIVAAEWPVGTVVASEAELLATYATSRSTLREAVRLLEHRSVAYMRRGPGGGLVVDRPDLQAVADALTLYLEYAGASPDNFFPVREAIELACLDDLHARPADVVVTALTATVSWPDGGEVDFIARANEFHVVLGRLTGNTPLSVLVTILSRLWGRWTGDPELSEEGVRHRPPELRPQLRAASDAAHRAVIDALRRHEPETARRRLRDHLQALQPFQSPASPVTGGRTRARGTGNPDTPDAQV